MFVSDDARLVRDEDFDKGFCIVFDEDALAAQARLDAGIEGTVNKILFAVRDFLEVLLASFDINMAGAASADHAAVVVDVYVIILGNL